MKVTVPHNWKPRDYQEPLWNALEAGVRRSAVVWHRRAGKDLFAINWCATQVWQRVGLYWHILPTYRQGRKVVWEGRTRDGRAFLDHFPGSDDPRPGGLVTRKRDDEMTLWFANGSTYQVIGADDPDRLVGANPIGLIFSEWSVMPPQVWEYLRPILVENGGWAVFIYTPRGRNHGFRLLDRARSNKNWFDQVLSIADTKAVSVEAINDEREAGMPEQLVQQEFYCSFDAPLVGAYYADIMSKLIEEGRISGVPHEPLKPVNTFWDLGIGDSTAIIFHQQVGKEHRLIDFYSADGVGLDHYVKVLKEKPYTYGQHIVPHDANVRELGTGRSRLETARGLGIKMRIATKLSLDDGINAVRNFLPQCWIDEKKCANLVESLKQYTKERVAGEQGPDGEEIYRDKPKHDWTSHAADALRTGAVGLRMERSGTRQQLAPVLPIV